VQINGAAHPGEGRCVVTATRPAMRFSELDSHSLASTKSRPRPPESIITPYHPDRREPTEGVGWQQANRMAEVRTPSSIDTILRRRCLFSPMASGWPMPTLTSVIASSASVVASPHLRRNQPHLRRSEPHHRHSRPCAGYPSRHAAPPTTRRLVPTATATACNQPSSPS
jgi:hypothetical protein